MLQVLSEEQVSATLTAQSTRQVPLSKGYVAIIDEADYILIKPYKWHVCKDRQHKAYAKTSVYVPGGNPKTVRMHRLILGCTTGIVDHIDGDGLNNCRSNLRIVTPEQNGQNREKRAQASSQYKGVYLKIHKAKKWSKWQAVIKVNKKMVYLGCYRDEVDAATAYNFAAHEFFGEFARFNTPKETPCLPQL